MKVLAVNSSPRGKGTSKTGLMLNHLVHGMREAGAEVEVVELRKKTVKNCIGCYTCWTKTPGKCVHKDDMTAELFPKWAESDLVVYATPLYHYTVNATMKAFIERTLPAVQPFFELRGDETRHPWRRKPPRGVVLSVAGFPEETVFDQLSSYVRFMSGGMSEDGLAAEIYRPAAETMMARPFKKERETFSMQRGRLGRNSSKPRGFPSRPWRELGSPSGIVGPLRQWPTSCGRPALQKGSPQRSSANEALSPVLTPSRPS